MLIKGIAAKLERTVKMALTEQDAKTSREISELKQQNAALQASLDGVTRALESLQSTVKNSQLAV